MKNPPNKLMTSDLERQIIDLYNNGLSAPKILEEINVFKTTKSIYDVLDKYSIRTRSPHTMNDPLLDHNYFERIDSPEKAYVLGLMISDGWVTKPQVDEHWNIKKNAQIAFSLNQDDKYMVEFVKDQWKSSNKISIIHKEAFIGPSGGYCVGRPMARIMVTSQIMYEDLKALGVDSNKSYVSMFPILGNQELYSDLIRGLLDGDGCVGVYKYSNSSNLKIKFIGTQCLMGQLSYFLATHLGLPYRKPISKGRNVILSDIEFNRDVDTRLLAQFLYRDCGQMALTRKKEIIENYFNTKLG